jgi:nicotinamidase-related amidase
MTVTNLDPRTTALVLIDLQYGIVGGPAQPHSSAEVIANAVRLAEAFRASGAPVVLVHVAMSGGGRLSAETDVRMPPRDLPPNAETIVAELTTSETDLVVLKRQWGAFYGTDFDLHLRRRGIRTIVLGGISTNMGVESTARDAWERGYNVVFAEDATAALSSAQDHEFAFTRVFPRIGRVSSTAEVLAALGAGA